MDTRELELYLWDLYRQRPELLQPRDWVIEIEDEKTGEEKEIESEKTQEDLWEETLEHLYHIWQMDWTVKEWLKLEGKVGM